MIKTKKSLVHALPTPDLNQFLSLELIGETIKARRTQLGITLRKAALLCDVTYVTMSRIENAKMGVKMQTILKIMAALNIKMSIKPWDEQGLDFEYIEK